MFRPFRPSFETLEKREVFSAGPLDSVAPLGDQPLAPHSKNEVAIETLEISHHAREQQRPDGIRVQSLVVDPRNRDVVYLSVTRPFADGLELELGHSQITAKYNGDSNNSAVFEPNDEPLWFAAARDGAPNGLTSGYGIDFNPTVDQAASQSGVLGLDIWEHAVTDRDSVVATDFNNDGRHDLAIQSPRDAASGLPTGIRRLLPYMEQDNLYQSSQPHDRLFAELGSGNDLLSRQQSPSQILIGLLVP